MWNIMSNDQFKTIEKNLLIQLPKSKDMPNFKTVRNYNIFSTKTGILNFVKDDISSNIIQYHNSLNNQNHLTVPKSSVKFKEDNGGSFESNSINSDAGLRFRHGLQVGSMFWLVFGEYNEQYTSLGVYKEQTTFKSSTMLWFSNRKYWRRGPDLGLNPSAFEKFCSSSLNSTAILFVFIGNLQGLDSDFITKVAIFNFQFNVWTDIPKMKENLQEIHMTCAMVTLFGKQTRPRIVVVFNGNYEYDLILKNEY